MTTPSPRILVVDDDASIRAFVGLHLNQCGFQPLLAANADEAVSLLDRSGDRVWLALLDGDMEPVDGPTLLEMLRRLRPGLRFCFMTGGDTEHKRLLGLGAETVFPKPFPHEGIGPRLRELHDRLGRPPA